MLVIGIRVGLGLLFLHRAHVELIIDYLYLFGLPTLLFLNGAMFSFLTHFKVVIEDHLVSLFFEQVRLTTILLM